MRGASALQSVLEEMPVADLRAFVVWEPVLKLDVAPPTSRVLNRIPDARVAQFWDEGRVLSARIAAAATEDPHGVLGQPSCSLDTIVWDWAAVYPPGVRWEDSFPRAAYAGAPVCAVIDDFRGGLTSVLSRVP